MRRIIQSTSGELLYLVTSRSRVAVDAAQPIVSFTNAVRSMVLSDLQDTGLSCITSCRDMLDQPAEKSENQN